MAAQSNIEWTDSTFNPWEGCQKVGPGCDHCYAENRNARFAGGQAINWGPGAPRRLTSASNWAKPLAWNRDHQAFFAQHGRRRRVFCASLADVFDNAVPAQWRISLLRLIEQTPHLDWLLLTKRIGNAADMLEVAMRAITAGREGWRDNYFPHVAIGATVVNQEEADRDVPKLLATPARVRFLSIEPMLGPVDIKKYLWPVHARWPAKYRSPAEAIADGAEVTYHRQALISSDWANHLVNWVIVGGESGPEARPMHPDWVRSLRYQCEAANTPFLFKQWGEWAVCVGDDQRLHPEAIRARRENHTAAWPDGTVGDGAHRKNGGFGTPLLRIGKKAAGRLLDGRTHDGFPPAA